MKPTVERILAHLAKDQDNNIEVNLEKVELAKKPHDVFNTMKKLEDQSKKIGETMYENRNNYNSKRSKLMTKLMKIDDKVNLQKYELEKIEFAAKELGIKASAIPGYDKAKAKFKHFSPASSYNSQFPEI